MGSLCACGSERTTMKQLAKVIVIGLLINALLLALAGSKSDAATNQLPCPEWHSQLRKHGLPVKVFAPIMWRESRCQPKAIGWNYRKGTNEDNCKLSPARSYRRCKAVKSFDLGLLQINSSWVSLTKTTCKTNDIFKLLSVNCNLAVASILYNDGQGLSNWRATSNASISKSKP